MLIAGCDRSAPPTSAPAGTISPTVVSLVPAATDLIVGMGAVDHLVGVSNYDQNPQVSDIRGVGDYLTTDWERIVELRPQIIITQYAPGRTPTGFEEHLRAIGSRQENLHIERVDDIFTALIRLGDICGEKQKADDALRRLRQQLQDVRERAARFTPTPALIVVDETGQNAAGPRTFLDDLLTIAGGKNVVESSSPSWPSIDRETLMTLSPQVIIQLLPGASAQVRDEAMRLWQPLTYLPAVRNHRIIQLTDSTVLLPGYHVGDLAGQMEEALHPADRATQPATAP
jgi:iron complex transport system substrate-binding protein